jgi:hypothetical protein
MNGVAYFVDSLVSSSHARPYKQAWPRAEALAELRRHRGRQFDPHVIDAFLALERAPDHTTDLIAQPSQPSPTGRWPQADAVPRAIATGRPTPYPEPHDLEVAIGERFLRLTGQLPFANVRL